MIIHLQSKLHKVEAALTALRYEYLMKVSIVNMMECSLEPCHMCGCGWKSLVHVMLSQRYSNTSVARISYIFGIHATKIWPWDTTHWSSE